MPSKAYYLKNRHTQIFKNRKKESDRKYRLKNYEKLKIKKKNINLIDESYNSNPLSLKSAIENFNLIKTNNKKHI